LEYNKKKKDLKFIVQFLILVWRKKGMANVVSSWTSRLSPSGHYIFKKITLM